MKKKYKIKDYKNNLKKKYDTLFEISEKLDNNFNLLNQNFDEKLYYLKQQYNELTIANDIYVTNNNERFSYFHYIMNKYHIMNANDLHKNLNNINKDIQILDQIINVCDKYNIKNKNDLDFEILNVLEKIESFKTNKFKSKQSFFALLCGILAFVTLVIQSGFIKTSFNSLPDKDTFEKNNHYNIKWITGDKDGLDHIVNNVLKSDFPESKVIYDNDFDTYVISLESDTYISMDDLQTKLSKYTKIIKDICIKDIKKIQYEETHTPYIALYNTFLEDSIEKINDYYDDNNVKKAKSIASKLVNFILSENGSNSYNNYFDHYILSNSDLFESKLQLVNIKVVQGEKQIIKL